MTKKKEINLTVDKYIQEKRSILNYHIKKAISYKERIHITAPVGSGKTTYIIDIIKKYHEEHTIIVLEPQKAISQQVYEKLKEKKGKKGIEAFVYNSDTYGDFTDWEQANQKKWDGPFISTIDSAYKLFKNDKVDPDNVIVIVDEDHTFLQNSRKDFDATVDEIILSRCPVIGFSASPSSWVNEFVFYTQKYIKIETTKVPSKKVIPYTVTNFSSTIAQVIKNNQFKKVVIFITSTKEQEKIQHEIEEELKPVKAIVLNASTKKKTAKKAWDNIVTKDKLPPRTKVAILNNVVQAGININDKNISLVMLVGKMDPLGFAQYLGRCRNYKKEYHYLYKKGGKSKTILNKIKSFEDYIQNIQDSLDGYRSANNNMIKLLLKNDPDLFSEQPDGNYDLNRCVAANRAYSEFRNLKAEDLLKIIGRLYPDIKIGNPTTYPNINQSLSNTKSKQNSRNTYKNKLPKLIEDNYVHLVSLIAHLSQDWYHENALQVIKDSLDSPAKAFIQDKFYILKANKKGLIETIETSKKANDSSLVRVLLAAKYYKKTKKKKTIKKVLAQSIPALKKHLNAFAFYEDRKDLDAKQLKQVLKDLEIEVDTHYDTKDEWLNVIKAYLPQLPYRIGEDKLARMIFDYCLISKRVPETIHRNKSVLYVSEIVYDYEGYRKGNNLGAIFD